jgi:transposase-like protein
MLNTINPSLLTCKYCGSNTLVKFGAYKTIQRYWCKDCGRKFKYDDSLFHSKVSAKSVSSTLIMYYCGYPINAIRDYLREEHDYYPSKSVVYGWIHKYTHSAGILLKDNQPRVGGKWILNEEMILVHGQNVWILGIFDTKTGYILSIQVTLTRTKDVIRKLYEEAVKSAGKTPEVVMSDTMKLPLKNTGIDLLNKNNSLPDVDPRSKSKFMQMNIIKNGLRRNFNKVSLVVQFFRGYIIHHNYFTICDFLGGKTPVLASKINSSFNTWADLIK